MIRRLRHRARAASRPVREPLHRGLTRLERHTVPIGLIVIVAAGGIGLVSAVAVNGLPWQDRYELTAMVSTEAPPLKDGDEVRIAGDRVGQITDVQPARGAEAARVTMEIDNDAAPVGQDARATVRLKSLAYLFYIQIDPGDRSRPLPEGATIPLSRSSTGTELLTAVKDFDRATRIAQKRAITVNGLGLHDQGRNLNAAIGDLPATLRQITPELGALSPREGNLAGLLAGARGTARGFQGRRGDDVAAAIPAARGTLEAFASRDSELSRTYGLLRPFEDQARATLPDADALLRETTRMARVFTPAARALREATPPLNQLLRRGRTLSTEVDRLADDADPVLRAGRPLVGDLYAPAALLGPFARPFTPFAAHLSRYPQELKVAFEYYTDNNDDFFARGNTAPNNPVLRFGGILSGCAGGREAFPEPGETLGHSAPCKATSLEQGGGGR